METMRCSTDTVSPAISSQDRAPSTLALHADSHLKTTPDVGPPLHTSTTFRYASSPSALVPASSQSHPYPADSHIYSRHTAPTTTRLEAILSTLLHGPCLTYSSGLSALHALYVFLRPRCVSIGAGYHGSRAVLGLHEKLTGLKVLPLECAAEEIGEGDVIHLETPVNPSGEARHIAAFAEKAHLRGAYLVVDATFGPPGLQDPFQWGADVVMHSGTKYLGGHSDLLMGVLAVREEKKGWVEGLAGERVVLGSVMGSLEGWLGVRSLRTLEIRVKRQSESAGRLVRWLSGCLSGTGEIEEGLVVKNVVERVQHASLQEKEMEWLGKQMPNGFGPVFAVWMKDTALARRLPSKLELFAHATSLGGVESLIEWRAMSDETVDHRVMRISIGLEAFEDLRTDLLKGFEALCEEDRGMNGK